MIAVIAAFFSSASFLKELLTPKWQKDVHSVTQEAVLALQETKRLSCADPAT